MTVSTPRMPQLAGNPIWFELTTPDVAGAKAFYTGLFGWEWADVTMAAGNVYHMAIRDDGNIAGMSAAADADRGAWRVSVYTADAEATCRRVTGAAGSVVSPPRNADGWGITATVATPEGAEFGLWQSLRGHGAERFAEPGAICWTEYRSADVGAAMAFYRAVFGADFERVAMDSHDGDGESELHMVTVGGVRLPCAFAEMTPDMPRPRWLTYLMVIDVAASVARATSLGATSLTGVVPTPAGSLAVMEDPQGVRFCLWQSMHG